MRTITAILTALLAIAALGCGEKEEPDPGEVTPEAITYQHSGGIAGISEVVEISPDDVVSVSLNHEEPHEIHVDPALVAEARRAVEAIDFDSIEIPEVPPIADGFGTLIALGDQEISGGDEQLSEFEELRPARSAFDAIIGQATATMPDDGAAQSGGASSSSP